MLPQEKEKGNVAISLLFKSLFHKRGGKNNQTPIPGNNSCSERRGVVWQVGPLSSKAPLYSLALEAVPLPRTGQDWGQGHLLGPKCQRAHSPHSGSRSPAASTPWHGQVASGWCPPYHQRVGLGRAALTRPASDTGGLSPRCASDHWVLGPDIHRGAGRKEENSRAAASLGEKDLSRDTAWGPWASLWGEDLKTWLERKVWECLAASEKQDWVCRLTRLHSLLPQHSQQLLVWQLTSSWEGVYWLTSWAKLSQEDLRRNLHYSAEVYPAAVSPCADLTSLSLSFLICEGKKQYFAGLLGELNKITRHMGDFSKS